MGNLPLDLIILAAVIVTAVVIIVALDRRSKKKGSILGDKITPDGWQTWNNGPTPPPLPIAQSDSAIGSLDGQEKTSISNSWLGKFFKGYGFLLVGAIIVVIAAILAAAYPDTKFSDVLIWVIVIGFIVVPVLSRIRHFIALIREK